jgi:BirA family transcriptional regulator, biotin operon repressor / biotin---[acetyl-CoA-carboxylase] ligase
MAATLKPFTCVTAREQTSGRGRFDRTWVSPRDINLYATLYFTVPTGSSYLTNIGQLMAFSCVKMLLKEKFSAEVKWPNDILIDNKKAGGVLTETMAQGKVTGVILGIGLNVNMEDALLRTIDKPATSLAAISGKMWDIQQVLDLIMKQFLQDLALLQKEGFKPFRSSFEKHLALKGQPITCRDGSRTIQGICHSMTDDGKLQLLLPSGELIAVTSGEIVEK